MAYSKKVNEELLWELRRRTNEAAGLAQTAGRLLYLLLYNPAVIYSREVEGNYATTFVSENVREKLGYEPWEFLDEPRFWVERIHPEDKAKIFTELSFLFANGYYICKYRFRDKNGSYHLIHDELNLMRDTNGEPVRGKVVTPEIKIDCPEEVELLTDRIKLFEVLTNLLRNTLVHAEEKPQVVLEMEKKKGGIRIVVEDKNPPIPKNELKKIFGRFYRGRYARRRTGSGLGLYISKRLVELMGGRVWAERKKDGNRFLVELPANVVLPNL